MDNQNDKPRFNLSWIYIVVAVALGYLFMTNDSGGTKEGAYRKATYSEFQDYVDKGWCSRIVVNQKEGELRMYVEPEHARDIFKRDVKGKRRLTSRCSVPQRAYNPMWMP